MIPFMKIKLCLCLFGITLFGFAQETDTLAVSVDSLYFDEPLVDSIEVTFSGNGIGNSTALFGFYQKLYQLEKIKKGKINIVHIGDSHIQADLFTAKIRRIR